MRGSTVRQTVTSAGVSASLLCKRESLTRAVVLLTSARLFSALAQAVVLAIAARAMTTAQFGLLVSVLSVASVAAVVADAGTTPVITRAAARNEQDQVQHAQCISRRAAGLVVMAWSALVWLTPLASVEQFAVCGMAAYLLAERSQERTSALLIGLGNTGRSARNLIVRRIVLVVAVSVAVVAGANSLAQFCSAFIAASVIVIAGDLFASRKLTPRSADSRAGEVGGGSTTSCRNAYLNSLGVHARQLDGPIVASVLTAAVAAPYAAVSRLTNPLRLLAASLASALLASASRTPHRDFSRLLQILTVGCVVGGAAVVLLAGSLVDIALGEQYSSATRLLQLAAPGFAASGLCSAYTSLLQALDKERVVAATSTIFCTGTLVGCGVAAAVGNLCAVAAVVSACYIGNWLVLQHIYRREVRRRQDV